MDRINEAVQQRIAKMQAEMTAGIRKRGGVNSRRADVISQVMNLMQEHTMSCLLRNALKIERGGYETIKHDPAKVRDWAKMVYNRRFKYWLGRTGKMHPDRVYVLMQDAINSKNPPALFNWLLNREKTTARDHS